MFKVYYHNRPPFSGSPEDTPVFGVLLIVEKDAEHGRRIVSGGDYYGWDTDEQRWYSFDYPGLIDYLQRPGWKRVLIGRMVESSIWHDACRLAESDVDFPVRTAFGWSTRVR